MWGSLLLLFTTPGWSAGIQVLRGHVPAVVARLQPTSRLPGTNRLNLAIGLPLREQAELSNLLRQIYDPASPNYRHYLTPEQFTEQFGPTERDYQAVIAFAKANGLTVTDTHPNRMLVDVSGSVADIERALHVTLRVYQHPTENRAFYAPDTEPSLDLAVPILSISGLDNYSLPRPRLQATPLANANASNVSPNAGSGPGGTYMGKDFRAAYVPDSSLNGSGQIVGLLQFDGYTASDITYYENQAGLPRITLLNVLIDGASGLPSGGGGEVEVSLDIEMAISMATNLSEVVVYMAPNPSPFVDILSRMANDNVAKQLSCSWYIPYGAAEPAADQIFQQMAAQGQSFFNASGDDDAYTGLIDFPGDTPYITQVGGTTLTTSGPGGSWVSETVWNWGGGIGSGGGISTQYPIPSWQTNISMMANQGSTTMRNTPDVALTADNVYVRADGRNYTIGGTSCAAPLWAGFAALVNQQAAASGRPTIGFINPAVDAIGSGPNYTSAFHDITTGNNTWSGSPAKFYAVSGYDLCTGWGTPAGQNLINALANPEALLITPGSGFTSIGGVGGPFTVTSESLSLTNAGTNSLTWTLVNTSLWLNASPGGGALTPGGSAATVTVSLNSAASNLLVGTYSATVWFTNLNSGVGQGRQFSLSVISPPTITAQPADQAVLEGATATFTVGAAGGLPLNYQWQDNGTNLTDGGNIFGSTTTNLIISNVSAANVGTYTVVVTNLAGTVTSSNAYLTITPSPPVIVMQPSNQTVLAGGAASFSVTAIGSTPLYYQWSFNTTNITGATNATLTLANVQLTNAGNYAVTITNLYGSTISSNALLTVQASPPTITAQPTNQMVLVGGTATFSVGVVGALPLSYQWSFNTTNIVGATNATLTLANVQLTNAGNYAVTITNLYGSTISSNALLTVSTSGGLVVPLGLTNVEGNGDSGILTQAAREQTVYAATNFPPQPIWITAIHFRPDATYSGGRAFTNTISNIQFHLSNTTNAPYQLNATFASNTGTNVTTVFNGALALSSQFSGPAQGPKAFDIVVPFTTPFLYDPQAGNLVVDIQNFSGETTSSVDENGVSNEGASRVSIANPNASSGTPDIGAAVMQIIYTVASQSPTIISQPTNQTVMVGGTAGFSVTAIGIPPLSYQWNFNGTNIAGATSATLTLTNVLLSQSGNYAVLVTNFGGSILSSNATLTVLAVPPAITQQPTNQTAFVGGNAIFSAAASGTAPLIYQWQFNGTNILGATNTTLTLTNVQLTQAGNYALQVTNIAGAALSSNAVLTVNPLPPVPVITGFSPAAATVGASVTISGTNFSPVTASNTVYFGAVRAAVTAASVTNLTMTVPAGATYAPITVTVNGLTAYADQPFMPTFPGIGQIDSSSLASRVDLPTGNGPGRVVIADLDGDGKPDLIIADSYAGELFIYRNISTNGSLTAGSFAPRVVIPMITGAYSNPYTLAVADLDGDGKLDIIALNADSNVVSIFRNISSPGSITTNSFAARVDLPGGNNMRGLAVQDLNGDGRPEIITANQNPPGTISIFQNMSTIGNIAFAARVDFPAGNGPVSVAIGDLDGDGKPDLAVVNYSSGTVSVFRNIGVVGGDITTNSFASKVDFPALVSAFPIAIGDLDGDGKLDLVVGGGNGSKAISVYRNTSTVGSITTNSFAPRVDFAAAGWVNSLTLADLDGDGKLDIALVSQSSSVFSIFKNVSVPGSFTTNSLSARVDYAAGNNPNGISVGDLDGDGRPDIVFANTYGNTLSIYRNIVPFGVAPVITSQPTNQMVTVGGTASFSVTASGTLPLSYQWSFNTTNIVGATNTTLTLTNAQFSQAGNYAVQVTNTYGSILSSNATLTVNDKLDHFVWGQIPSPRFVNVPFTVVIQALDVTNGIFTNFTDAAFLVSTNGVPISPAVSGNFVQGVWTGAITVAQTATNLVLQASNGSGQSGLANPINIVNLPSLTTIPSGSTLYIFWPVNPSGFSLETTACLLPADWVPVTTPPFQIGDQYLLPIQISATNAFYRLRFSGQ